MERTELIYIKMDRKERGSQEISIRSYTRIDVTLHVKLKMSNRYILFSLLMITTSIFDQKTYGDQVFDKVIGECNNTYPVVRDLVFTHDLDMMINLLKSSKNGKCFLHCFLNKIGVVDIKGNTKTIQLLENLNKVVHGISNELKLQMSEEIKKLIEMYINHCEQSEMVKNETDACEKVYKFVTCFKDTE